MTAWAEPDRRSLGGLVEGVRESAARSGGSWFPELDAGPLEVRVTGSLTRSRCFLHRLELGDGRRTRPVVVKVRHSDPALRRPDVAGPRPVLAPVRTLSDRETGRREFDGLVLIQDAVAGQDERFGFLRPLAWLPEHAALVTDLVEQPTLRSAVLGSGTRRGAAAGPPTTAPWAAAGAWLRCFHEHEHDLELPVRAGTAAEVTDLLAEFAEFLRHRLGEPPLGGRVAAEGVPAVAAALPDRLPLGTGHGDFVANNMFLSSEGRITVFDPLPLWRVPVYQDLATMTVGLRLLWSQLSPRPRALSTSRRAAFEAAMVEGYFGATPVPGKALAAFGLLVLLDRWCGLVSRRPRRPGFRPVLREARVQALSRRYRTEARNLLEELTA